MKRETITDTDTSVDADECDKSDKDNNIKVFFESEKIPPDFRIQGDKHNFEIHSIPHQNPITDSNLNVDIPLGTDLSKNTFKFLKGYNLHAFYASWGQIDQLCLGKHRYLRLMTVSNMVRQDKKANEAYKNLHRRYKLLNKQLNAKIRQIWHEHNKINKIIIQNSEAEKLQVLKAKQSQKEEASKSKKRVAEKQAHRLKKSRFEKSK